MNYIWNLFMYSFIEILYENKGQHRVSIVRGVVLIKDEIRVHINPSYSLTMCLHGMCPSSTIVKQNTLHRSRLQVLIPCLATIVYVGYCLFSLYGIPTSIGEVLSSLGAGMRCYLEIAQKALKMLVSESLDLLQYHVMKFS